MSIAKIIEGVMLAAVRRTSSANGNPRFRITVDPGGAEPLLTLITEPDASISYSVDNFLNRNHQGKRLRFTTNGRGQVTDITFQDGSRA